MCLAYLDLLTQSMLPIRKGMHLLGIILLLLIAISPARAAEDGFVSLGGLIMKEYPRGGTGIFPAGTKAKILDITDNTVVFGINGKKYSVPKDVATYYFESVQSPEKYLIGEALDSIANPSTIVKCPSCVEINEHPPGCPWKNGVDDYWTAEALRRAVSLCPVDEVNIVKRKDKGEFSENCRNPRGLPDVESGTWQSCASPPVCSDAQSKLKRDQGMIRNEEAKQICMNVKGRHKAHLLPEEQCMVPFNRPITKLVIHQTDAPMDRGPGEVYNWHRDRDFDDVSYHYIIAKDADGKWRVYEGRPKKYEGAHGGPGANSDSLGIAIAGCYKSYEPQATSPCVAEADQPPPEAVRLLTGLVAKLKNETVDANGKPTIKEVLGHGEHRFQQTKCLTGCPGPACQILVNRLQERFFGAKK